MRFFGPRMIIFGHFPAFLASFKISFSSLYNPSYPSYITHICIVEVDEKGLQAPQALTQARQRIQTDEMQKTARQIRQEAAEARLRAAANEDADNKQITLSALAYA